MSALAARLLRSPSRLFYTCLAVMLFFATGGGAYLLIIVGYLEKRGLSVTEIGAVMSLLSVVEGLVCLLVGQVFHGRRTVPALALALLLNALSAVIMVSQPLGPWVWLSAALTGGGFAIFTVVMYVTALRARPEHLSLGLTVGLYTGCIAAGNGTGALLGGWMTDRFGFATAYWVTAGCYLAGMLVLFGAAKSFSRLPAAAPAPAAGAAASHGQMDGRPIWVVAILTAFCLSSLVQIFDILFPVYSLRAGLSFVFIGSISGLKMILAAIMRPLSGLVMARWSPVSMNSLALMGLSLGTMILPAAGVGMGLVAVISLMGVSFGAGRAVSAMLAVEGESNPRIISRRVSFYNTGLNLGQITSPWLIGLLADRLSISTAFWAIPACFLALTGAIYLFLPRLATPPGILPFKPE